MIRAVRVDQPKDVKASVYCREFEAKYRQTSESEESFDADRAELTEHVVLALIRSPEQISAMHAYYADRSANASVKAACDLHNAVMKKQGSKLKLAKNKPPPYRPIGTTTFQARVRDVAVQIGMALDMIHKDLVSVKLLKELAHWRHSNNR